MKESGAKWCCDAIRQRFDDRNDRGFFIFAEPPNHLTNGRPSFWVGINGVDQSQIPNLPPSLNGESILFMLKTWAPIHYCPWCGTKLGRFYTHRWEQLFDEAVSADHDWPMSGDDSSNESDPV